MLFRKLIIAVLAITFCITISPDAFAAASVGQKAPALVVTDLQGHKFDLQDLRGKTVVVTLWASWCQPCLEEIPALNSFYQKYHVRGVEMIALSVDRPHDRDAAKKAAIAMHYPVALSADALTDDFDATGFLARHLHHRCQRQHQRHLRRWAGDGERTCNSRCNPVKPTPLKEMHS